MAQAIRPPPGPPAGFPGCPQCTYLRSGPPRLCLECASATFERIAPRSCPICSQLIGGASCPNRLCTVPGRRIARIRAIAYSSGELRKIILRYKYYGRFGWALIFGRILVGWLDADASGAEPDLIVANPTFPEPGTNGPGHTEAVLAAAEREDVTGRWRFAVDPPAILKIRQTQKSAGASAGAKRTAARELRHALRVTDVARTEGKYVLVYDDVCTTGSQLNAVAA